MLRSVMIGAPRLAVLFGVTPEIYDVDLEEKRWVVAFMHYSLSSPRNDFLVAMEAMRHKLAHTGVIVGRGYRRDIAGGKVYHAVNDFMRYYNGSKVIAVSADDEALFVLRVNHDLFRGELPPAPEPMSEADISPYEPGMMQDPGWTGEGSPYLVV